MLKSFFSKPTSEDLLKELQKESFNESKADSILEHVDINAVDNDGKTFLHHVCFRNIVEPIRWLVRNGIEKEVEDYYGETALSLAIKEKSFEAFHQIIQLGVNVDIQNRYGRTAVQESLLLNDSKFYNAIRNYSKNINTVDKQGRNALFDAVLSENLYLIKEVLLEDIDKTLIDKEGKPALLLDNVLSNIEILKELVKDGVDISLRDSNGNNLLFYLAQSKHFNLEIFDYVLENKIDSCCVNNQGNTVLLELLGVLKNINREDLVDLTKEKNIITMIERLLEHEIDLEIKNDYGQSAIVLASLLNDFTLLKMLLDYGSDINSMDAKGNTALSLSIMEGGGEFEILELLLSNGAKIDLVDVNKQSIIEKLVDIILYQNSDKRIKMEMVKKIAKSSDYVAILTRIFSKVSTTSLTLNSKEEPFFFEPILYGNFSLVKLFIQAGSNINQVDKDGLNIIYKLMSIAKDLPNDVGQKRYHSTLKSVIDMRANGNALDKFGGTALHKAILENDVQTVKMLMNSNSNMDAKDKQGRNYMHNSIWKNRVQIMRVVHATNAKLINTPDGYGVLPINYAAFLGYTDLVIELITLGANINNTYKKKPYILEFLQRFHKNIVPMIKDTRNATDQRHVSELVKNMREEFEF